MSLVEAWDSAFLSRWKRGVRPPVKLTSESEAISRGTTGLSGLPSCRELILGVTFQSLQGNEALSLVVGDIGVFLNSGTTRGVPLEFQGETGLLLRCDRNIRIPLQTKQGNGPSSRVEDGKPRLFLSCGGKLGVPLQWTGISGTFLSCIKGVKYPFAFQAGTWDFSGDTALERGLISR